MATPIHLSLWIDLVVETVVRDLQVNPANGACIHVDGLVKAMPVAASRKGEFPALRKLSARTTVWVRDEVVAWFDARLAK